jgi:hypothetical protein
MYKELVEYVVKSLVEYPDEVQVSESVSGGTVLIELSVAQSDMGRVIGKRGRVINAIRSIAQVLGSKQDKRVNIEVLED